MHRYCVIPDSCRTLLEFMTGAAITAQEQEILRNCRIAKITVDGAKNSWEIMLEGHYSAPARLLDLAAEQLQQGCGLAGVTFLQPAVDPGSIITAHWQDIIAKAAASTPAVKHLLFTAPWSFVDGRLIIQTAGTLAAELVAGSAIKQSIELVLRRDYGCVCAVEFAMTAASADAPADDDLLTPEYLEALTESTAPSEKKQESPLIFGRAIKAAPQPIREIREEARNVVIAGELGEFEGRELRSGRFLLTFSISDATDGLSGKVFIDEQEQFNKIVAGLKTGMIVKAKGTVQYDKFAKELVLFADAMSRGEKPSRMDHAEFKRVEFHAHTQMSNMDGVVSVKDLIKEAARWQHPAIAITDHGVVQAFPEAHDVAAKCGIKVIYGMEGYLFDTEINRACHIVILAQNPIGLRNLYRLVSLSHLKYMHRTPRIPRQALLEHREGLILGSACEAGELIRAIVAGSGDEELLRIAAFYDYLEVQPIGNNEFLVREGLVPDEEGLRQINRKVCELGERLQKPVIATGDVHFLNPEDEMYRRILMAGKGFSDAEHQPPLYLRTTQEMLDEFTYLGARKAQEIVVDNPRALADSFEAFKPIPDELYSPQIPGAEEQIRSMSYDRAHALYGEPLPEVVASRLEYELNAIINNGFAVLYLIAHKLVKKSLDDGYLVGSRGSVGSSFVATMTNITEVNPLPPHWRCPSCRHSLFITDGSYGGGFDLPDRQCDKCGTDMEKNGHDIPFAVFMGFHGDKVPDIDLNFSGDYQPVAHKYTEELFGRDNVFRAGTIATIADKTAYGFVKKYFDERNIEVRDAYINNLISGCTGVKRTTGQHPGGIMVVPRDMDVHHFTPIQHPADDAKSGTITTHFDYHSISSRLVKLDILGHDDPTVIKMLEDLTGIDAKEIPFDDPATMSLFSSTTALNLTPEQLGSKVGTFGIPEYGTKFVRQMLEDTTPQTFSELVRISGFSHGTDVWLNNAQDLIKAGTAKLSEAISARDDIMVYLIHKGLEPQLAFKIMEGVRKGKGVKPDDVAKMKANQVPDWYIESCQKIKYMFPKAHAVAYVMMAFRIAYCKVYYPLAFYASYFTVRATEFDADLIIKGENALRTQLAEFEQKGNAMSAKEKGQQTIAEMALEMYLRGFTFMRVDLYRSDATRFIIEGNGLLPPLASLQGLGETAAHHIVQARQEREFSSMEDIRVRGRASKTVIDIMKNHGCLEGMSETDQIMLFA